MSGLTVAVAGQALFAGSSISAVAATVPKTALLRVNMISDSTIPPPLLIKYRLRFEAVARRDNGV
jgi:hypothetical protein